MSRLLTVMTVAVGVSLAAGGCSKGPALGTVKGTVTLDGKPHANALVTFTPEGGGGVATGMTDDNGKYELVFMDRTGAILGKHKVSVSTIPKATVAANMPSDSPEYAAAMEMKPEDYENANKPDPVPERYNVKTELTAEVKGGANELNFDLKTDGTQTDGTQTDGTQTDGTKTEAES